MTDKIRIVLVDDHPLWRQGVSATFSSNIHYEIVGEGETATDAVRLAGEHLPDIILLDVSMPGNGIEAAQNISMQFPAVKIVMLTVSENEQTVLKALKAGAKGYILKGVTESELIRIVADVHAGEIYITPTLAATILMENKRSVTIDNQSDPLGKLTNREREILFLLSDGLTNQEIAEKLNLSVRTIKHYMTNILQKLQFRNRVEAALWAQRQYATDGM